MADNTYQTDFYVAQGGNAVHLPGTLGKGYIDLGPYIFNAKQLASAETAATASGVVVNWGGTPPLALTASGDQSIYVSWVSADVAGIKLPPIFMPGDMSTADGVKVGLYGETVGSATAADTKNCVDIKAWFDIGDTECGATHPDWTSTPGLKEITIASGDVSTGVLNITLAPQAHAGRAMRLYGGRVEYTRKTS